MAEKSVILSLVDSFELAREKSIDKRARGIPPANHRSVPAKAQQHLEEGKNEGQVNYRVDILRF